MLNNVMCITFFFLCICLHRRKIMFAWYFLYHHHHQLSAPLVMSGEMMKLDQHQAVYYYKHKSIKITWLHFIDAFMNKSSLNISEYLRNGYIIYILKDGNWNHTFICECDRELLISIVWCLIMTYEVILKYHLMKCETTKRPHIYNRTWFLSCSEQDIQQKCIIQRSSPEIQITIWYQAKVNRKYLPLQSSTKPEH